MKITEQYLKSINASESVIHWVINNNLIGMPASLLKKITGDYKHYIKWLKAEINNIKEYDGRGNIIHYKDSDGYEYWREYDANNNIIHFKDSDGYEKWQQFDANNNLVLFRDSYGVEKIQRFDENSNLIYCKDSRGYEEWQTFDRNNNLIYRKNSRGYECWREFDSKNNLVYHKNSTGYEKKYIVEYYPDGQLKRYEDLIIPHFTKE